MVAPFLFSDSSFISNTDNIGFQWLDAKKAYMKIFPKKYPAPFMYIPGRIVDATTNWLEQRLPWKWLRREYFQRHSLQNARGQSNEKKRIENSAKALNCRRPHKKKKLLEK